MTPISLRIGAAGGAGSFFWPARAFFLLARAFSFDVGRILFFRRPALCFSPTRAIFLAGPRYFFAGPRYVFKRRPALIIFCWPNLFCVGRPSLFLFLLCSFFSALLIFLRRVRHNKSRGVQINTLYAAPYLYSPPPRVSRKKKEGSLINYNGSVLCAFTPRPREVAKSQPT